MRERPAFCGCVDMWRCVSLFVSFRVCVCVCVCDPVLVRVRGRGRGRVCACAYICLFRVRTRFLFSRSSASSHSLEFLQVFPHTLEFSRCGFFVPYRSLFSPGEKVSCVGGQRVTCMRIMRCEVYRERVRSWPIRLAPIM